MSNLYEILSVIKLHLHHELPELPITRQAPTKNPGLMAASRWLITVRPELGLIKVYDWRGFSSMAMLVLTLDLREATSLDLLVQFLKRYEKASHGQA